jgi:small subunit ribosomal protein S20
MANIKSQIKRNRQNEDNRARNKSVRSRLKTLTKKVTDSIEAGDDVARDEAYREAVKAYDQAAAKGVIHPNKAANAKSRLAKRLNA